jgi:hypothetical protein
MTEAMNESYDFELVDARQQLTLFFLAPDAGLGLIVLQLIMPFSDGERMGGSLYQDIISPGEPCYKQSSSSQQSES